MAELMGAYCNVGPVERAVRVLVGLPALVAPVYLRHFYAASWSFASLTVGIMFLLTAALRWCPVKTAVRAVIS